MKTDENNPSTIKFLTDIRLSFNLKSIWTLKRTVNILKLLLEENIYKRHPAYLLYEVRPIP